MTDLSAVSLFAGVGGFDLAMERNGINVVADVEIDKAARSVLERRFPNSKHFNDVTEVTGEQLRDAGFVPDRGVITGGFPCQDLSVAGKRAGLAGSRSGLFWEIIRLAKELRPKFLILENVPGLLSAVCPCNGNGQCVDNGRLDRCEGEPHNVRGGACEFGCFETHGGAMGVVLGALAQLGYGIGYRVLDAQFFGVPQRRRRVFIVGCLGDDGRTPFEILALAQGVSGDIETGDEAWQDASADVAVGFRTSSHAGYERGVGTLRASGGDLHGGSETLIAHPLNSHHPRANADETLIAHTLTAEYDASEDGTGRGVPLIAATLTSGADGRAGRRREDDCNLVPALLLREGKDGGGKGPLVSHDVSLTLSTGNGQVLIQPFNKVVRSGARDDNGELAPEVWRSEDVAPTLSQFDQGEVRATTLVTETVRSHPHPGSNSIGATVATQTAVRRLTPTECERLQGFPDGWTEGQADSARYRQMGNAVAVPVVEWIMKRLVEAQ